MTETVLGACESWPQNLLAMFLRTLPNLCLRFLICKIWTVITPTERDMASSHHFMGNRWGNGGNGVRLYFFWAPKSLQMVTAAMKLKDAYSVEGKL